jgi:hypothetical protein
MTISMQDMKGTLHMKRGTRAALVAAVVGALLAFAGGAFAANTGSVAVWHTPMVLGGSDSTTIHITLPQATDPIAAINIYVPAGCIVEHESGRRHEHRLGRRSSVLV